MEKLIEILNGIHPEVDFEKEDKLLSARILTSFDVISIIMEIQSIFGVKIKAKDITPEHFDSAAAIYELIENGERI